jgi:hypothetical protein
MTVVPVMESEWTSCVSFQYSPVSLKTREQRKVSEVVYLLVFAEVNIYFDARTFVELRRNNNENEK